MPPDASGSEQQRACLEPDIARLLNQTNRGMHEQKTCQADEMIAQAEWVTELRELQALLGEPRQGKGIIRFVREMLPGEPKASIREITLPQRIALLLALIERIGELPNIDRPAAFNLIGRVVTDGAMPMTHRAGLLTELAWQIGKVNAGDRLRLFDRIHDAVSVAAFPMALRAEPLVALASQIGRLRAKSRLGSFHRIYGSVTAAAFPVALRAEPLTLLAGAIGRMRQGDGAWTELGKILAATNALPTQYRPEPLIAVVNASCYLQAEQQWDMLNRSLAATAALEQQHRAAPLLTIGLQLSEQLTGIQRCDMFDRLLMETAGLADPQIRVVPLEMLARQIPLLPVSDRLSAYSRVVSAVDRLAMQNRYAVLNRLAYAIPHLAASERPQVLRQFIARIGGFDDSLRHEMFQQALTTINVLPADDSVLAGELLGRLRDWIPVLPERHRKAARRRVREAETLLEMAPDVREHYRDSGWINLLARARYASRPINIGYLRPNGDERKKKLVRALDPIRPPWPDATVELQQYIGHGWPNGMDEARQYWRGSVRFDVGKRNVLLERIDLGGATRWYLAGQNGERLSQYLDRRYGGRLTPDA